MQYIPVSRRKVLCGTLLYCLDLEGSGADIANAGLSSMLAWIRSRLAPGSDVYPFCMPELADTGTPAQLFMTNAGGRSPSVAHEAMESLAFAEPSPAEWIYLPDLNISRYDWGAVDTSAARFGDYWGYSSEFQKTVKFGSCYRFDSDYWGDPWSAKPSIALYEYNFQAYRSRKILSITPLIAMGMLAGLQFLATASSLTHQRQRRKS